MAHFDGLIKLADAAAEYRIDWLFGCQLVGRKLLITLQATDQDGLTLVLDGHIDLLTGETWVQLPMDTVDDIVCQAGERAKRAELDRRLSSSQRIAPPVGEKTTTGAAQRRAPVPCRWHRDLAASSKLAPGDTYAVCPDCHQAFGSRFRARVQNALYRHYGPGQKVYPFGTAITS